MKKSKINDGQQRLPKAIIASMVKNIKETNGQKRLPFTLTKKSR